VIRRRAPDAARVVFETGPLSVWFFHALTAEGLPAMAVSGISCVWVGRLILFRPWLV
jgi:hypothetical protein